MPFIYVVILLTVQDKLARNLLSWFFDTEDYVRLTYGLYFLRAIFIIKKEVMIMLRIWSKSTASLQNTNSEMPSSSSYFVNTFWPTDNASKAALSIFLSLLTYYRFTVFMYRPNSANRKLTEQYNLNVGNKGYPNKYLQHLPSFMCIIAYRRR